MPRYHERKELENFSAKNLNVDTVIELNEGTGDARDLEDRRLALNRLYRKLDIRIIPALWIMYFLSSFGGAAYGHALTMNMHEGHNLRLKLNMTANDVSTATALDYVGYIIFDLPMNLAMSVIAPHAWMSRILVSVGVVYTCYAALSNATGCIVLRLFTGIVTAGIWPGMAYYISMWYTQDRAATRIGYYYTAAQLSAAVAGLVAAGFQKMDGTRGYTGYEWMFLIYGVITVVFGILLMWFLPDRPEPLRRPIKSRWGRILDSLTPKPSTGLTEKERLLHAEVMQKRFASPSMWNLEDLIKVLLDVRIWPLVLMYFGVVGVGIGIMNYATTILASINPNLSDINLSLLIAPIWLFDLAGILLITPISDRFPDHRGVIFCLSTIIIIVGLVVTTYGHDPWSKWGGLLLCGFGLGPTVPLTMTWASTIFSEHHGDLGAAASTALVSGLGNLGSVTTTYALYSGWPEDAKRHYRDSNMVMVAILGMSMIAAVCCTLLRFALGDFGDKTLIEVISWRRGQKMSDRDRSKPCII